MAIVVVGATGFLGSEVIPKLLSKGHKVYGVSRHWPEGHSILVMRTTNLPHRFIPLIGDIGMPDLGLEEIPGDIDQVIQLAAIMYLGEGNKDELWRTNVDGTSNVLSFCSKLKVPLVFVSTAYTLGRNDYESSKGAAEELIRQSPVKTAIIKPSILVGTPDNPGPKQAINEVALSVAKIHKRTEEVRKRVESTMALPPLELGLRVKGNPNSTVNIIPVDIVAEELIALATAQPFRAATFYATNPNPPTIQEIADGVGNVLSLNIHVLPSFRPSPVEKLLDNLLAPFHPYMNKEPRFPTMISPEFRLHEGYIEQVIAGFLRNY